MTCKEKQINMDILSWLLNCVFFWSAEKLDDEYLYNWYRTLYELFSKSGLSLYHTSSHDPLCLQVTLMQSCVYFLAYARVPGPHVFSMYPPAECGKSGWPEGFRSMHAYWDSLSACGNCQSLLRWTTSIMSSIIVWIRFSLLHWFWLQ